MSRMGSEILISTMLPSLIQPCIWSVEPVRRSYADMCSSLFILDCSLARGEERDIVCAQGSF